MKTFLIKFLNVVMYCSFGASFIAFVLSPFLEIGGPENPYYSPESPIKFWETLANLVNYLLDSLNIDYNVDQVEVFIMLFFLSLLLGFICKFILKKLEYSNYQ